MTVVTPVAPQEVQAEAMTLVERARALRVLNDADLEEAASFLRDCKTLSQRINETFDPIINAAHRSHTEAIAQKKKVQGPVLQAEQVTKVAIATYYQEQEAARRQAQREAEEAARRAREDEERARAAELERRMNAERETADALADRSAQLEREGRHEEAAALMARAENAESDARVTEAELVDTSLPSVAPAVIVAPPPLPKVQGVSVRDKWTWTLLDKSKLKPEFLIPDEKAIGAAVRSLMERAEDVVGAGSIRVEKGAPTVSGRGW